jgi:hypothetical protein
MVHNLLKNVCSNYLTFTLSLPGLLVPYSPQVTLTIGEEIGFFGSKTKFFAVFADSIFMNTLY